MPQPPIDPTTRDPERHGFWLGGSLVGLAVIAALVGVLRPTSVPLQGGGQATSTQLMRAFASGGLERVPPPRPPDLSVMRDPVEIALAMERWNRERSGPTAPPFRVNPNALNPCPT